VLRLRGDLDGARSLVDQLPNPGPEEAIVLALLDLGAPEPAWTTVLDRLQTAARAEQRLGRAAAYYVYAAALAGQPDRAREQLDLLGSYAPPHPLVEPLRRWLAERPAAADGGVGGGSPDNVDGGTAGGSDEGVPADFRQALKQAREALRDGKLDRADTLYQAALDKNPGNTEALAGLAEVAHARGDSAAAIRAYEGLLRQNPGYLPAMVALADLKWQTGAKAEARTLYRQVVEAAPGSSYAAHARSRLESGESSAEPKTAATATTQPAPKDTGPAPAPTNPEQPPAVPPGVDTSDLPDLH
jgi:tetratricopeptide (TPR) repeat protein